MADSPDDCYFAIDGPIVVSSTHPACGELKPHEPYAAGRTRCSAAAIRPQPSR